MPHNKEIEEIANKIVNLTQFGQPLHKNDILPDLNAYGKSQYDKGVEEGLNKVAIKVAEYIEWNWHASLGYGDDTKIIERALDDLNWILAVIPKERILKAIEDNK